MLQQSGLPDADLKAILWVHAMFCAAVPPSCRKRLMLTTAPLAQFWPCCHRLLTDPGATGQLNKSAFCATMHLITQRVRPAQHLLSLFVSPQPSCRHSRRRSCGTHCTQMGGGVTPRELPSDLASIMLPALDIEVRGLAGRHWNSSANDMIPYVGWVCAAFM